MVKRENFDELSIGTSDRLSNIEGTNLSIDSNGNLNAAGGDGGGGEGYFVEDFEDGDITDYEGDTAAFSTAAGDLSGGTMLQFDGAVNDAANAIATNSIETRRGMSYATYLRADSTSSLATGLIVCTTTSSGVITEGYNINIRAGSSTFAINYKTSTTGWIETNLDTASATISANTLYRIEVDLTFSGLRARFINDETNSTLAQVSSSAADAAALTSGGWGYYGASSAGAVVDFDMGIRLPTI